MRFSGILSVVAAVGTLVGASGCGDDKAAPIVNDDISWQLGCAQSGCTLYQPHSQANIEQSFKVSCKRTGAGITITLRDPGFKGDAVEKLDARPASVLTINNGIPNSACDVSISEGAEYTFAPETLVGSCSAGDCTFSGTYDSEGWDFIGELNCKGLRKKNATGEGASKLYTLRTAGTSDTPVKIAVDNCD